MPKNDTKRRTHPVLCSVDVPLTYHNLIQRDTVRIAATVAVHFEFESSFFNIATIIAYFFCFVKGFSIFYLTKEPVGGYT